MKSNFTLNNLLVFVLIVLNHQTYGWGTDVVISPFAPSSQHSMAAKGGELFAATAGVGINGPNILTVFQSVDEGNTWSIVPLSGLPASSPVGKTKMVVTALDSVYCLFIQDNQVYFLNVESGLLGQFNTTGVEDFDAVSSVNGNWIYVYIDEPGNNSIKRYGTQDGGITWTGNTATVTSNGAHPKICLFGTQLILNYYGPVLPDTATSDIRAAVYTESSPGTLTPGTFQDVVLSTGVKRKQFESVINMGIVWFIFTEGDAQQVIKCISSNDNGATYQAEFTVAGDASISAYWFDAESNPFLANAAVTLTCLADSISPVGNTFDEMLLFQSNSSNPNTFNPFPAPNTYNDTTVTSSAVNITPIILHYASGGLGFNDLAISWIGESPLGPWFYFDALSLTTGINETNDQNFSVNTFPSPASDIINVAIKGIPDPQITLEILNAEGRLMLSQSIGRDFSSQEQLIPVKISSFAAGNYIIRLISGGKEQMHRFVVQK